jgi:ribosome-binding factor A
MATIRQEKINNLIKRELLTIFQQTGRSHFGGAMITVTKVNTAADLGAARIYVSIFAAPDKEQCLRDIKANTSQIRHLLGNATGRQLRKIPELFFYLDDSLDYYETIDNLLKR